MRKILVVYAALLFASVANAAPKVVPTVFTKKAAASEISDQLTYPARVDSAVNAKLLAEADGVVTQIAAPLGAKVGRQSAVVLVKNMEPGYSFAPMRVTSPVAGVVSQVKVSVGSQVSRGQEIATVIDPKSLRVVIEIAAGDLAHLRSGLKGDLHIAGQEKPAQVVTAGVSPLVDPVTGTATAELRIDGKQKTMLSPGTIGQVRFKANLRHGIVLPDTAIVYRGDATNVRLVVDGKAKLVPVKIGKKTQGTAEIVEGIKIGDEVIVRTSKYVADGEAVKVEAQKEEEKAKL